MESAELKEATPSGCLFSDWISRRGGAVEVWLSAADETLLTAYADALGDGMTTADALAAVGRSGCLVVADRSPLTVPMESDGPLPDDPMESDGEVLPRLRDRLAALRDAVELGAPLSSAEVALLLGARPGGAEVVRGRIRAVRLRRNLWTLEPD
jgi:hypothetical protein